jgi:hypothetical protein
MNKCRVKSQTVLNLTVKYKLIKSSSKNIPRGKEGEMTQTLYTHMNKRKNIYIPKHIIPLIPK